MERLADLIESREDWLIDRLIDYVVKRGYSKYTSTLEEAWRASVRGLSAPLIESLRATGQVLDLGPDEDHTNDPAPAFEVMEAQRHRARGITIEMFLGLMKYYRQSFIDLVCESSFEPDYEKRCRLYMDRFFDRVEISFCGEWARTADATLLGELRADLRIHRSAMNAVADQIMITNLSGCIEFVNPAFERDTGYTQDEVIGKNPKFLNSGKQSPQFYADLWNTVMAGNTWSGELTNRRKNGTLYSEAMTITPIRNDSGEIERFVAIKRNLTQKQVYEEQLDYLAYHDPLTNLPNRLLFSDRLTQRLTEAQARKKILAVMFLDIDRFKLINDTLGHNMGDLLLAGVAQRLSQSLRGSDILARMGGDEFTLILSEVESARDAGAIAARILKSLAEPFAIDSRELFISASIGISLYPSDGADVETLVRNADAAMYRAKEQSRGNHQFYTESMNAAAVKQMTLEHSLRKAIERDEFLLHYQLQVGIASGEILGVEALARWQHPEYGFVPPGKFIPLAEDTGLILPIGKWVLRSACEQAKAWTDAGHAPISVAVNVSAHQLQHESLIVTVGSVLAETELEARLLELELTESALMRNPELAIRILSRMKEMGVRISIDDFGTGYSSLSYLKRFPIDAVKIDQAFIRDITTNPDDAAIAGAVVAMAHSLKLKVIAEGVETLEQLEFLRSLGCDEVQGYFISMPVPADEITRILTEQREALSRAA